MSAPERALRLALGAALAADAGVKAVLGDPVRLYARRSARAAFPHASWGRAQSVARGADGVDLIEHRLTLDVWCREEEPEAVIGALRAALAGMDIELPAPWVLVSLVPAYADVFATRDEQVRRGLVRLRAVMGAV